MGVVDEPVENSIGEAAATEVGMPVAYRQLRGDDGSAGAVSLLNRFEQIPSFGFVEGSEAEVVDNEQ